MISILNRKELTITFSMEEQAKIRDLLSEHRIDYHLKTVSGHNSYIAGSHRSRTGTLGENLDCAYEYIFYVHKDDYENARALIGK